MAKDPVDKLTHALCGLGRPFEIFNSKRKLFYYHSVTPQYRTRGVNMLYAQRTAMPRSPTSDRCDQLIFRGKVGKSKDLGDLDKMVFRTYVERVPGILASHWFVWKANHNLKEYKTLPRRYRKVDYGGVMPPSHVVERIRTGRWFKVQNVYDDYDSYLTKWGCERISVPFLRQQRKD